MAENTKIEWCTTSLNPYPGCSDVVLKDGTISPACTRCYAKRGAARMAQNPKLPRYHGLAVFTGQGPQWTGRQTFVGSELDKLRRFTKPHRIFWESMGDIAHESTPLEWFRAIFSALLDTVEVGHWHYLLTKRPARLRAFLDQMRRETGEETFWLIMNRVVVMTTTEDQRCAEDRVPALLECPARYFGVSAEPLVGPLDLRRWLPPHPMPGHVWAECLCTEIHPSDRPCVVCETRRGLNWVICGGMSGPGATPMHPAWARDLRDQCAEAGIAFFFKQWGEWVPCCDAYVDDPEDVIRRAGYDPCNEHMITIQHNGDMPQGMGPDGDWCEHQPASGSWWMIRVGKKAAGRLLDGVEHGECPRT